MFLFIIIISSSVFWAVYSFSYIICKIACYFDEIGISELENKTQMYSEHTFKLIVFEILMKNKILIKYESIDEMMIDAIKLYKTNNNFKIDCYRFGIKPRFVNFIQNYENNNYTYND
jgi:hypothetical protein